MRARRQPIAMLTCYDFPTAQTLAAAGVHILLVGDSAANTVLGLASTREIPVDFLMTITAAVRRGAPNSFVMADMPHLGMATADTALTTATRFMRECQADAVKVECTGADLPMIQSLLAAGIPVCAHLGLLPQRVTDPEGYRAQGRTTAEAQRIIGDAILMRRAGAQLLLLEAVPDEVSAAVVAQVDCPVLGCGAGPSCDGHVIVWHDLLGFNPRPPRFAQPLADAPALLTEAAKTYVQEVASRAYPALRHQYHMKAGETVGNAVAEVRGGKPAGAGQE